MASILYHLQWRNIEHKTIIHYLFEDNASLPQNYQDDSHDDNQG